ncbi:arabinoxylan arabinofuranohydrolase [Anaerotaenia torta]|uniref:glycoside hydrolase family 43 protein n=1 Tax=Anaerotaenia torta TaxID=433293 RepID=UPI003D1F9595
MMRKHAVTGAILFSLFSLMLTACQDADTDHKQQMIADADGNTADSNLITPVIEAGENDPGEPLQKQQSNKELEDEWMICFDNLTLTPALKNYGFKNPLMTQRLGADPYAMVYNDRVYLYMTGDTVEYDGDGKVKPNSYSRINTLNVISSPDLVNWTDHGAIKAAGPNGAAKWGNNSWAPAAAHKVIDGKDKFFIYFANGGNGIGVLTSDSPTGPFTDPLGHALISRSTPNCGNVAWLFDPAVLVDDDGKAYLYFGGGIPDERYANPGTGRAVQLGEDMISLAGDPVSLDIPYLFEDSGINKIGDTYYYSYCSNWNVDPQDAAKLGFQSAEIVYMTGKNPLGPFMLQGSILKNPGIFFGCYGNNHHCMFRFKDQMYMAYHTQILENRLDITGGYRCTHIDPVTVSEDGVIQTIKATEFGVKQVQALNPYERVEAETIGTMGGITTKLADETNKLSGTGNMAVTDIHTGDWIAVYGVDFGDSGADHFTASIRAPRDQFGAIQIRLDKPTGTVAGYLKVEPGTDADNQEVTVELLTKITGVHDLVFVFYGEGYELDYWYFK